jgi:hypothetical protein
MKFSDFKSFLDIVQSIISIELEEAKQILKTTGKNIKSINDIFINNNDELFELLPDGTLVKINLYIATKVVDYYSLNNMKSKDLYKYHIYRCATISNMFNSGRKHRYKINNRDDGTFFYTFTDFRGKVLKIEENQKLNICKNCLKKFLGYKYISDLYVRNFKLNKFHQQNNSFFDFDISDMEKGANAKANVYVKYWDKISRKIKIQKNYSCENCRFKARKEYEKRFIHTHHTKGDKQNNYEDNLKVLCIKCHSEIDIYHTKIKATSNYQEFLELISRN